MEHQQPMSVKQQVESLSSREDRITKHNFREPVRKTYYPQMPYGCCIKCISNICLRLLRSRIFEKETRSNNLSIDINNILTSDII